MLLFTDSVKVHFYYIEKKKKIDIIEFGHNLSSINYYQYEDVPLLQISPISDIARMTVLEFWGGALIAFGPALAMFSLTVAHDPIKVILLISSSFFWLLSFLAAAICWALISTFCDCLIIGAILAVFSQEVFRCLFHIVTKKAQIVLAQILANESEAGRASKPASSRTQEIQISESLSAPFQRQIPLSYGELNTIKYY